MLGGCFDAAAAVADAAHQLDSRPANIGFRQPEWRKSLRARAPELHQLTEAGTPVRAVIDLVAQLRNTIHGDPPQNVESRSGTEEPRHLIDVPARAARELVD